MFADEAFALHFVEDIYAAGHIAGTWGDVSQRKGTHDFYNASGLEMRHLAAGAQIRRADGRCAHAAEDAARAGETVRLVSNRYSTRHPVASARRSMPYAPTAPSRA